MKANLTMAGLAVAVMATAAFGQGDFNALLEAARAKGAATSTAPADKQYETLIRNLLPQLRKTKGVETSGVDFEAEIAKELRQFRALPAARQKQKLEQARMMTALYEALPASQREQVLAKSVSKANATALSMRGRNLFVGIVQANTEREAAGLPTVWPKAADGQGGDKDDISGKDFASSSAYFRELFDLARAGRSEWSPYVSVDRQTAFEKDANRARWIVARGVEDEMSDAVPVLVSANVDPRSLVTAPGAHDGAMLTGDLRFTGDFAVVVKKGGAAQVIDRKHAGLSFVYGRASFTLPKGFGYLAP